MFKANILIVEDEIVIANNISEILKSLSYDVAGIALNGEEAISEVEKLQPDLILMDIILQGEMDGVETATQIKERFNIPIVYVTSSSDEETLERAKSTTPYGYILKPFSSSDIYTVIEIALYKHKMEKQLAENEEKLRTITDTARDAIILVDKDDIISFWNPSAEEIFGFSAPDIIGKKFHTQLIPEEHHIDYHTMLNTNLEEKTNTDKKLFETWAFKNDGTQFPIEFSSSAFTMNEERHVMGIVRDISERKNAEKERESYVAIISDRMRELDCLYRIISLIENPDITIDELLQRAVIIIPSSFRQSSTMSARIEYNGKEYKTNNYKASCKQIEANITIFDNVIGKIEVSTTDEKSDSPGRPISDEEKNLIINISNELSRVAERKSVEYELREYREGLEELVRKRTEELTQTNEKLHDEIKERIAAEHKLKISKELAESANNAKSEFLATMSHELRTPLNSILGFTKLMKMGYDEEDYIGNLEKILSSGEHLLRIINDILDLSKIEAGQMKMDSRPVYLNNIVSTSRDIVSIQADKKEITIIFAPEIGDDKTIQGDEKRLQQIFLNLLSNAIKFTENGGTVTISSRESESWIYIDVIDSGIGISEENQKIIFNKFVQVKSGLNRGSEGTGLGLTITQKIVEAHGGKINLKSEPGEGSTFTVKIPRSV